MPKSRRERVKPLTKTSKKGNSLKKDLIDNLRKGVDEYSTLYVFSFENMRTVHFKDVRMEFRDSRFFLGKNKVMQFALGNDPSNEYRDELHLLSKDISANVGVLCTNKSDKEVEEYFNNLNVEDYARSGFTATESVSLKAGPLPQFVGSMIESLRKLGLPVQLKNGVIELINDHTICKENETLTPEQAKLLVHFDKKMADFRISLVSRWRDGKYNRFSE